jgi:hypothetical protein
MAKRGKREWWWADEMRFRYVRHPGSERLVPGGIVTGEFVHDPPTRPLQPAELRIVAILIDLYPPDGDPGSRSEKAIRAEVETKLKAEHNDIKLTRSVLWAALTYVRDGKLPPRRR